MKLEIDGRPLHELSDAELRNEAKRRRIERSGGRDLPRDIRRYLASLELTDSASRDDVERAYRRLQEKYDPEKRRGDRKKYEAAKDLSRSLRRAYRHLVAHFDAR